MRFADQMLRVAPRELTARMRIMPAFDESFMKIEEQYMQQKQNEAEDLAKSYSEELKNIT